MHRKGNWLANAKGRGRGERGEETSQKKKKEKEVPYISFYTKKNLINLEKKKGGYNLWKEKSATAGKYGGFEK